MACVSLSSICLDSNVSSYRYLNEGRYNTVFSYIGYLPDLQGKALRIKKPVEASSDNDADAASFQFFHSLLQPALPFCSAACMDSGVSVIVPQNLARQLFESCESLRSRKRVKDFASSNVACDLSAVLTE